MKYKRSCPNCNKKLYYSNEKSLKSAIKNNTCCQSCGIKLTHKRNYQYKFSRNCPLCNNELKYKTKKRFQNAVDNSSCMNCRNIKYRKLDNGDFKRICPICNKIIQYNNKRSYRYAIKKQSNCWDCISKEKCGKYHHINLNKGKTYEEIFGLNKATKIKQKLSASCIGRIVTEETKNKIFQTKFGLTYIEYLNLLPKFKKYKQIVINITKQQPLCLLENFDKRGKKQYHLDHIISIHYGFKNNIPPEIIGNIKNLQMLWYYNNLNKSYIVDEKLCKIILKELNYETN